MSAPHEIIAGIRYKPISFETKAIGSLFASAVISDLRSAGFHILSDADLQARDDAVLEKAAEVAERWSPFPKPTSRAALYWLTHCAKPGIAAAIRAMQGGKP